MQETYQWARKDSCGDVTGFWKRFGEFNMEKLDIFLANRQIYHEASAIFYSCDNFDFDCAKNRDDSLMNILGFLLDRPKHALLHLRSIRFALNGPWGPIDPCNDKLPRVEELKTLCDILSNDCHLSMLDIVAFGTIRALHPSIKELRRIKDLRDLRVVLEIRKKHRGDVQATVDHLKFWRKQSIIGDVEKGSDGIYITNNRPCINAKVSTISRGFQISTGNDGLLRNNLGKIVGVSCFSGAIVVGRRS